MKRVFMVGYSQNKGGVEAYISNITPELEKLGFDVIYSMPEMVIDGKRWLRPSSRHNYLKYWLFWNKFFRENKFDALYLNTCDIVSIDDLKFGKRAGIPVRIIHSHSTGNQQAIERKMSLFHQLSEKHSRRVLDQYATHMFACSKVAGDWMFDGRAYEIIKNGIQISKYQYQDMYRKTLRSKYGLGKGIVIGIIGRISAQKNPLFSVKIIKELVQKEASLRAIFVGDGELRQNTEGAVKQEGLEEAVEFIGAVDNVNEWLSVVDVLLMPSLFEGLPYVLVEAQTAGLPCVVSTAVSEEANISGQLKYVSLEEKPSVWAEAVFREAQMGRYHAEYQLIEAEYSIAETAQKVTGIIKTALNKQR